ncbi:MAG: methylmalonyl-CoA mutase [Desulfobacterium sp.]|nr:methylmalonyl-CoA mutase [Desulfobacterium sp.]MBU3947091.1 cobalamin-dependent protein [Pseudomonadota bacterium]MBU4009305.1 cobalamin-dependent protein [Pseudomonadota bacterium]
METKTKKRVLVTKSDQDAHEVSVRYLTQLLRDKGMEVIFTRYAIIDEVVKTAMEEDVDVIAMSFYSSGLMYDTTRLMELLKEQGLKDDIKVIIGGTISDQEKKELLQMGVDDVFMPGMGTLLDVVECVNC